jgi:hypothetical protein
MFKAKLFEVGLSAILGFFSGLLLEAGPTGIILASIFWLLAFMHLGSAAGSGGAASGADSGKPAAAGKEEQP